MFCLKSMRFHKREVLPFSEAHIRALAGGCTRADRSGRMVLAALALGSAG